MSEYIVHHVHFDDIDAADVVRNARPLEMPLVPASFVPSQMELPPEPSLLQAATELASNEASPLVGADGRYFENKLTHTVFFRCTARLTHSSGQASAFVVGPRLIMTAGHCVHPGGSGEFYKNIYVSPGYPTIDRTHRIKTVFAHKSWVDGHAYSSDLALCITEDVVSPDMWFGVTTSLGDPNGWAVYGYPGRPPFDSKTQIGDSGPFTNKPWSRGELRFNLTACDWSDLTPGASGGPWLCGKHGQGEIVIPGRLANGKPAIYVNGLSSFFYDRYPGIMISPYFGSDVADFVRKVLAVAS